MNTKYKLFAIIIGLGLVAIIGFLDVMNSAFGIFALIVIALFVATGIGIVLLEIIAPLSKIVKFHEQLAEGNYAVEPIGFEGKGEIKRLADAGDRMLDVQKEMIAQITGATQQVKASSQELVSSGKHVGDNAHAVSAAIEHVASGAVELSEQINDAAQTINILIAEIRNVSDKSVQMSEIGHKVTNNIETGTKAVNKAIDQMQTIKNQVGDSAKSIKMLEQKSNEVGNIVTLISGIADQTNLLALNASIEAARAGEHGRGFAVVAEEVRKLAEESADATDQITDLIEEIRKEIMNAVKAMEQGMEQINHGAGAIQGTGAVFGDINNETQNLLVYVRDVNESSAKMADSSSHVNETIADIASVSEIFSANSEEVAAASTEQVHATEAILKGSAHLATMAERLSAAVSGFSIDMSIQWSSGLSVGHDLIDEQHQELIRQINLLLDACNQGKGAQTVSQIVAFLEDYVVNHFGMEEEQMRIHNYPGYEKHKQQHTQFVESFLELKAQMEREGTGPHTAIQINQIIVDWLIQHITKVDKALGKYLQSKQTG